MKFPVVNGKAQYEQYIHMAKTAVKMTQTGWRVDRARLLEHKTQAEDRAFALKKEVQNLTSLDPGDSGLGPQWLKYFLTTLQLPPVSFDKHSRKPQLNQAALITYATDYTDPHVRATARALWLYRKNTKLLNAFINPLVKSKSDRIHPSFNVTGTKGARWSASGPNIQQISKAVTETIGDKTTVLVPSFKDIFIADEGCMLLRADFNALELRILTHIAGVSKYLKWMNTGLDPHLENALALFGLPRQSHYEGMKKTYSAFRTAAKPIGFGLAYNASDNVEQLWKQLKAIPQLSKISVGEVKRLRQKFFQLQPEVSDWQQRTKQSIDSFNYIEAPIMQRRLYLQANTRGYNMGLNFQMQTTGGDLINRALCELGLSLDWDAGQQIRAQVHDELILSCREGVVPVVSAMLKTAMERPLNFNDQTVVFPAEIFVGKSWGKTAKL